jgi:hypothetical protein
MKPSHVTARIIRAQRMLRPDRICLNRLRNSFVTARLICSNIGKVARDNSFEGFYFGNNIRHQTAGVR